MKVTQVAESEQPSEDVRADMIKAQDTPPDEELPNVDVQHGQVHVNHPPDVKPRKARIVAAALRQALKDVGARGTWTLTADCVHVSPKDRGKG